MSVLRHDVHHLGKKDMRDVTTSSATLRSPGGRGASLPSLRGRLLLSVNGVLAVVTAVFLLLDYQHGIRSQVTQKQVSLAEEARTMLYAVGRFRMPRLQEAQNYIDAVCASMRNDQSPGHHIALRLDGAVLQALAHGRASPEMLSALERGAAAADHQADLGGETLVVGSASQGDDIAYVAEYLSNLRRAVLGQVLWRLAAVAMLAVLAAVTVNLVLLRLVARPVGRLAGTVRQIAAGKLGLQTDGFATAELATLSEAIDSMSSSLAAAERERNAQLAKARRVQAHLLPEVSAIREFQVAYTYWPAEDVGGDYFDVSQRPDRALVFCVADVSGHGIAAALEAMVLKALFLEAAETDATPAQVLQHINGRFLAASLPEDFATMLVGRWDSVTGRLDYASAGHEPACLVRAAGGREDLGPTGLPLGVEAGSAWETKAVLAGPGDRLFLVTDGLREMWGAGGEMFGRQRLVDLLSARAGSLPALLQGVEQAALSHRAGRPGTDDVTLVAIELSGGVQPARGREPRNEEARS